MPATLQTYGIDRLPFAERIALVQEIWDSIAAEAENHALTLSQRDEIDRRMASHESNPQAAIPWERVEAEALARLNR
ncbi:MAG: addiction module protein [Candidatus Methylumidiphilus alinenensis]|uniref:Addiction module protein n=1 Tax=Candidatus Methylumidiphilus alinenensis TaxID=2202197 RepID=A0A2W4RJH7_9GAMM|nr:MAG: addiction module protein [Candidatus Methylumidiphilus alinenensis]